MTAARNNAPLRLKRFVARHAYTLGLSSGSRYSFGGGAVEEVRIYWRGKRCYFLGKPRWTRPTQTLGRSDRGRSASAPGCSACVHCDAPYQCEDDCKGDCCAA